MTELFVPTVALHVSPLIVSLPCRADSTDQHNLTVYSVREPNYQSNDTTFNTMFCCGTAAAEYYKQWRDTSFICREGRKCHITIPHQGADNIISYVIARMEGEQRP